MQAIVRGLRAPKDSDTRASYSAYTHLVIKTNNFTPAYAIIASETDSFVEK